MYGYKERLIIDLKAEIENDRYMTNDEKIKTLSIIDNLEKTINDIYVSHGL